MESSKIFKLLTKFNLGPGTYDTNPFETKLRLQASYQLRKILDGPAFKHSLPSPGISPSGTDGNKIFSDSGKPVFYFYFNFSFLSGWKVILEKPVTNRYSGKFRKPRVKIRGVLPGITFRKRITDIMKNTAAFVGKPRAFRNPQKEKRPEGVLGTERKSRRRSYRLARSFSPKSRSPRNFQNGSGGAVCPYQGQKFRRRADCAPPLLSSGTPE